MRFQVQRMQIGNGDTLLTFERRGIYFHDHEYRTTAMEIIAGIKICRSAFVGARTMRQYVLMCFSIGLFEIEAGRKTVSRNNEKKMRRYHSHISIFFFFLQNHKDLLNKFCGPREMKFHAVVKLSRKRREKERERDENEQLYMLRESVIESPAITIIIAPCQSCGINCGYRIAAHNYKCTTSMDAPEAHTEAEKASDGVDGGKHDAKGVKAEATPAASSGPQAEQVPRSAGENAEREENAGRSNGKKEYRASLLQFCTRLKSGSGSGDQDSGHHDDGTDITAKKRKTRRGKPKHRKLKPYSKQLTYHQQQLRSRTIGRIAKTGRQPPAPYNTTQFLMADHGDLPDLEQKLSEAASLDVPAMFPKPPAPTRTRDSSFSVDSDEDYFYSSPEDEEEFLTKEFSTAYEALHEERLNTLTKTDLIQEYKHLEAKMDSLTKRLRNKSIHQMEDSENKNVANADAEIAKKLKLYQQRIDDLIQQNEQLRRENEMLRSEKGLHASSSDSSVDSESDSDSDSDSNSNHSGCSCSLSSPETSPKHTYKFRLDNSVRTDSKSDSCDTSPGASPRASITPTNFSNGHTIMNETGSFPT